MDRIEFFKSFPLLPPQSLDPLVAKGCIELDENGECIQIAIDVSAANGIYCVDAIESTPEVSQYLASKKNELDIRFKQCTSALSFVKEIQHVLNGALERSAKHTSKFYSRLIDDCEQHVGWENVDSFDRETQILTLWLYDASKRRHNVYANFISESFSSDIEDESVPMEIGICRYLEALGKKCEELGECWKMLDDIDNSFCVLQPQSPKRSELWRRVAVGRLASALVEVSSDRFYPRITVYGPSNIAEPLNAKAKATPTVWSSTRTARENVETILGLQLPEPESFDQRDIKLECGICFAYRVEGEDADQVCSSDPCAQPFHRSCLIQVE
ncbi:hypothetical protein GGH99_001722 [Coemansia sp. RSA 1285]|nr:hypothetical protein GGH99_001722 [Coemansia sp. RSA 1285]